MREARPKPRGVNIVAWCMGLPGVVRGLSEDGLAADPMEQFARWFASAKRARMYQPNAFSFSTATPDGRPASRMLLLKGFDARGFVFYTNYESRKGEELAANPRGAMLFFWSELHRQVRIEGGVERIGAEESARYFHSRPRGSQIGAWASHQSRPLASRGDLVAQDKAFTAKFAGQGVPLPPYWGGVRLRPERFEFWQGRAYRLHDRLVYTGAADHWTVERLSP